jgi:hypothetical protein
MSLSDRVDSIKNLMSVLNNNNQPYFTKDYLVNILNLKRCDIRKSKIKKVFNEQRREI